jgi:hypothetical protein
MKTTFRFFLEWLFEQVRKQVFWIVACGCFALCAPYVAPIFNHGTASSVPLPETAPETVAGRTGLAGTRAPAGSRAPAVQPGPAQTNFSSGVPQSSAENPGGGQNGMGSTSDGGSGAGEAPFSRVGGGGIPASYPPAPEKVPKTSLPSGSSDLVGDTQIGGIPVASPSPDAAGGSGAVPGVVVQKPAAFSPGAGFQITAGGGVSTGANLQLHSAIGGVGGSAVQTTSSLSLISGIEGVLFH